MQCCAIRLNYMQAFSHYNCQICSGIEKSMTYVTRDIQVSFTGFALYILRSYKDLTKLLY